MDGEYVVSCDGKDEEMSSLLLNYLVNREEVEFSFGDWLASLGRPQLDHLICLCEGAKTGDEDFLLQVMHIAAIAIAAETSSLTVSLTDKIIDVMLALTTQETLRRSKSYTYRPAKLSQLLLWYGSIPRAFKRDNIFN